MAVVGQAQETPDSPEGGIELGRMIFRRYFQVECSSVNDGPITAVNAPGIPPLYSTYAFGTEAWLTARLRRYEPRRKMPGSRFWRVGCVYETPERKPLERDGSHAGGGTGQETPGEHTNPLLEIPTIKAHFTEHEEIVQQVYDVSSGLVVAPRSTAGEAFDPPPKRQARYCVLEISRNEDINTPVLQRAQQFQNATNADYFWGFVPGSWRCANINPERATRQLPDGTTFVYLRVTYTLELRDTWDDNLLDYGNVYDETLTRYGISPGNANQRGQPRLQNFKGIDAIPRTGLLDGAGNPLPDRAPFTSNGSQFTVTAARADQFCFFRDGLCVWLQSLGSGNLPRGFLPNTNYYVQFIRYTPPTAALQGQPAQLPSCTFTLSQTPGGPTVFPLQDGEGTNVIVPQPVYLALRKYPRVPFAPLNLPQSFTQVQ